VIEGCKILLFYEGKDQRHNIDHHIQKKKIEKICKKHTIPSSAPCLEQRTSNPTLLIASMQRSALDGQHDHFLENTLL
jgi:hypothetical protein